MAQELTRGHLSGARRGVLIGLPPDNHKSWLGLGWNLAAMVPASTGGGTLQPGLNSLVTKRVECGDVGGMLSGGNALAPLLGCLIFQVLGATWPFLLGRGPMAVLLPVAWRMITPCRDEQIPSGLARNASG